MTANVQSALYFLFMSHYVYRALANTSEMDRNYLQKWLDACIGVKPFLQTNADLCLKALQNEICWK